MRRRHEQAPSPEGRDAGVGFIVLGLSYNKA